MSGRPKNFQQKTWHKATGHKHFFLDVRGVSRPGFAPSSCLCFLSHCPNGEKDLRTTIKKWQGHSMRTSNFFSDLPCYDSQTRTSSSMQEEKHDSNDNLAGKKVKESTLNNKHIFTSNSQLCSNLPRSIVARFTLALCTGHVATCRYYILLLRTNDTGCGKASFFSRINGHDECFRHVLLPFRLRWI